MDGGGVRVVLVVAAPAVSSAVLHGQTGVEESVQALFEVLEFVYLECVEVVFVVVVVFVASGLSVPVPSPHDGAVVVAQMNEMFERGGEEVVVDVLLEDVLVVDLFLENGDLVDLGQGELLGRFEVWLPLEELLFLPFPLDDDSHEHPLVASGAAPPRSPSIGLVPGGHRRVLSSASDEDGPMARGEEARKAQKTRPWAGTRQNRRVHIPAKVDYGMRALLTLAALGEPATSEDLARAQGLPAKFLGSIMTDLRRAGLVSSQRGSEGGFRLGRPGSEISVADVMRALDGPLAEVRGLRPELASYEGAAEHLQDVWVAVRAALRGVLEQVSLDDVVQGRLPRQVARLTQDPDAWQARRYS